MEAFVILLAAGGTHKEKGQCSRTGVTTDDRPHEVDNKLFNAKAVANDIGQIVRILLTVAMADKDNLFL